ncbi:MAG: penicillin-binding protein [Muribaculaceae bacterium]|nr:penicillin-binding protein [Muribaculaceae bacterium]
MKHKESSSSTSWLKAIARGWRTCKNGYKSLYRGKPWYIKVLVALATIIVSFFLYLVAVDINFLWLFGKSPSTDQVMHPKTNQASYIYSADGKELGKYFDENRTIVAYDSINPEFFKVLIDTEDERFYSHHGIDYGGLIAAVKDMILHGKPRGASTITQQLVKNMFRTRTYYSTGLLGYIPGVKMLIMKSKEWILATKIEMFYDKSEILEMYANTVDFGSNAYGIKTAARTYFGTTPQKLKLQESAVLVGLLKATSTYNPRLNPKNSLQRRNVVLDNMRVRGDLTQAQYDSVSALPIELNFSIESAYDGEALYFREAVKNELDDWCRATNHDLFRDGLKIYTTIDTRMQKHAEQAVSNQMRKIQENFNRHWGNDECWIDENGDVIPNFVEEKARTTEVYRGLLARFPNDLDSVNYYMNLPHQVHLFDYENDSLYMEMSSMDSIRYMLHFMHTGFIAMEPQTGHVKAWVGDVDFDTWKYDKVSTKHQPGSTFKLFVYSAAMERGMVPCDRRRDQYFDTLVFNERTREMEHWHPTNANGHFSYSDMTLRSAFAQSVNSIAVRVGIDVGIPVVAQTARDMGITSPLEETLALSLGASDVSLLELVNAYGTVVADGQYHVPVLVTHIVDQDGNEVYRAPTDTRQALSYRSAFFMQQMLLAGVNDAGGTSQSLNNYVSEWRYGVDFGGKTGTSNRHADAWFVGVTPKLVCGAWVGGEYRQIHFRTGALGQGNRTALPICGEFLKMVFDDPAFNQKYGGRFGEPKQYIDPNMYQGCVEPWEPDTLFLNDSIDFADTIPDREEPAPAPAEPAEPAPEPEQ